MNHFLEFLKKHLFGAILIVGVIIVLVAVAGMPLLINWAFTKPAWCNFFAVDWEAKDALAYYGSALGFIGTVIFSALALWQNHVIQEANNKHTKLLEDMEKIKNAPHLAVHSICSNGKTSNLKIHIKNTSENIAENIFASGFTIVDEIGTILWNDDTVKSHDYLIYDRTFEINWGNTCIESDKSYFIFDLKYNDKFNDSHTCRVVGFCESGHGLPRFKLTEL